MISVMSPRVSPDLIKKIFGRYGSVNHISIESGSVRNKYDAELEMPDRKDAEKAIEHLNQMQYEGELFIIEYEDE